MQNVFKSITQVDAQVVKWIDTRYALQNPALGLQKYGEKHVEGALYWDLEKDLSDMTKDAGRHPLPDKEALTHLFRKSGLELDDEIIVYDDGGSPFAARAWWILQYAGFRNASIAIEGFTTFEDHGVPLSQEQVKPSPSNVEPEWKEEILATRELVEETVHGNRNHVLLDARSAERYRGEVEPIDPIAGRIPGALNFDWEQLKQSGSFNLNEDMKYRLEDVVQTDQSVIVYCGSGVTAAPLYAMLKQNGFEHVRLYVGSYSDWISKEPIEIEKS
ncbi:sulfurtransferase [Sporosarcina saromensis]|uniref:Sulfurtransferase n=1 Tax=Sporosarcina saromensis TaxID=359365 RepID=A0ABU4G3N2_9BACL|nr:sulfurtransferase [Sporosarcina saromensis]MDW0111576.1 sulfurtransferase [Sporosarcina saromensis]